MPLQISNVDHHQTTTTTTTTNPNQNKKANCQIVTKSDCTHPQRALAMNDELKNKSWQTQMAQLMWLVCTHLNPIFMPYHFIQT
jgi:hypothetical protein